MNFYAFHIGDYASATRHLSWEEDLAYRRLIDTYYMREGPLPVDRKQVYRLVVATSKVQREAVDTVLEEFFILSADGYANERCDSELKSFRKKSEKARQSAEARWNRQGAQLSDSEGNANAHANAPPDAMRTHSEGNAPITHNPVKKEMLDDVARARDPDLDLERQLRKAAGWESQPAPMLAVTGEIQALIDSGADLELDVLPVIRALAPKADPTSWRYFVKAIVRSRNNRIAAATVVSSPSQTSGNNHGSRKPAARQSTVDTILETLGGGVDQGG